MDRAALMRSISVQSKKPVLCEFGEHWLMDYELWEEHEAQQRAAQLTDVNLPYSADV